MNNVQYNYGDLKIFRNRYSIKSYYGCMWISYNNKFGIGFWQQITNNYASIKRLKRYNPKFEHMDY